MFPGSLAVLRGVALRATWYTMTRGLVGFSRKQEYTYGPPSVIGRKSVFATQQLGGWLQRRWSLVDGAFTHDDLYTLAVAVVATRTTRPPAGLSGPRKQLSVVT